MPVASIAFTVLDTQFPEKILIHHDDCCSWLSGMPPLPDIANTSCAGEYDIGRFGYYIRNPAAARVSHA